MVHLRRAHLLSEVPAEVVAALRLKACRYCGHAWEAERRMGAKSPLSAHEPQCRLNPKQVRHRWAAAAAAGGGATDGSGTGSGSGSGTAADAAGLYLFDKDHAEWRRRLSTFLTSVAPPGADLAPLVASGARTVAHVPHVLLASWRRLGAAALDWARVEPRQQHAWLWLLLLPSLLLHVPTADLKRRHTPLSRLARAAAVLDGDFFAALAERDAGIWRPPPPGQVGTAIGTGPPGAARGGRRARGADAGATPRPTAAQRRALRLVVAGRLSAAARALTGDPPALRSLAVWLKALRLFPRAGPGQATPASVEADFAASLSRAAEFGGRATTPRHVSREAVTLAIRSAPRRSAPGPSGLRMEHLWALGDAGRDALVGVVSLLVCETSVTWVPDAAKRALSGADLLLLRKPGGEDADGLPKLRPIGMPEVLRKLAASALAGTMRSAAAELLGPLQLGVGVPNACERVIHALEAHLGSNPDHAVAQLDFRNAFNNVARAAAKAFLSRGLPVVNHYMEWVYGGEGPRVGCG
ncbi:hypothetical protein I4F81_009031 [Pyropia yezoensis]|uniref:Uncharacterized protein n=1 Tax=Pyropia yezoensis TaxID=2788 RepID=A0ACC3C8S3_PYRYE|nr:hypothetical protein I4F81_009031 [Neopyropia yezoensis]